MLELHESGILSQHNVKILGTSVDSIVVSEDENKFASLMEEIGEPVAKRFVVESTADIETAVQKVGFPMILRNGFALGGLGSCFINNKVDLQDLPNY